MYGQQPIYNQPPIFNQPPMYGQTGYMAPPIPMYPQPNPNVIVINKQNQPTITNMDYTANNVATCRYCSGQTKNVLRRKAGCVTISWCICLLATTGLFFWLPFCCDGCKDTQFMCGQCGNIKSEIPANCC